MGEAAGWGGVTGEYDRWVKRGEFDRRYFECVLAGKQDLRAEHLCQMSRNCDDAGKNDERSLR